MKPYIFFCYLLFFAFTSSIFLAYYMGRIFHSIPQNCNQIINYISFQNISSKQMKNAIFDDDLAMFDTEGDEYFLVDNTYYNLKNPEAQDIRFLRYIKIMNAGSAYERSILKDQIAQFLRFKGFNRGTVFHKNPFSQKWYNLTSHTNPSSKLKCFPARIIIEKTFNAENVSDNYKLKLMRNEKFPGDLSCNRYGCFEFFIRSKIPLQVIENCFTSDYRKPFASELSDETFKLLYTNDFSSEKKSFFLRLFDESFVRQVIFSIKKQSKHEKENKKAYKGCKHLIENESEETSNVYNHNNSIKFTTNEIKSNIYYSYLQKIGKINWIGNPCYEEMKTKLFDQYLEDCYQETHLKKNMKKMKIL
ncbi:hypothetical protein EDEG_02291 [Edhazardia aedis USNM 41457]|uniref:Uncharacterized protein n=1 Tax=Edhazardia aedis (strain USNM 41457) TaxID=1003232 RepID=J9D6F1_EDHAE|nr:hypothetical protein EDEG_02291 [Edhazardia aedis USNM 41457]|eukprot:EJW03381.1 hypothetical protein EDEG_02291 [Edhazardia aedis USNM 41457]